MFRQILKCIHSWGSNQSHLLISIAKIIVLFQLTESYNQICGVINVGLVVINIHVFEWYKHNQNIKLVKKNIPELDRCELEAFIVALLLRLDFLLLESLSSAADETDSCVLYMRR